jgi:hypothetical protein
LSLSFLSGGFANLQNRKIGSFEVCRLVGRDNRRIPVWEVWCPYGHCQTIGHLRLVGLVGSKAPNNLQCTNAGCPLFKSRQHSESLSEFVRREQREAEQTAQTAAEAKAKAEQEWAQARAKEERLEKLRCEYITFWTDQIKIKDHPESEIPSLRRWLELSDGTRQMILERIHQTPGKRCTF